MISALENHTAAPVDSSANAPGSTNGTTGAGSGIDPLASEDTFLKLLVAQIQNQDPSTPADPTQFVSQLTQYSELEQLMQINAGISQLSGAATSNSSTTSGSGSDSSGGSGSPSSGSSAGATPFSPPGAALDSTTHNQH